MSIINPLTASSDIARARSQTSTPLPKESLLKPELGSFATDVVKISRLGLEKQQKEIHIEASREIEDIANEVIRISSTIGRARSVGNLTPHQASELYSKIANLL
ncbi:MAG: hypothetical protein MJK15_04725 [Colwellia sp.]|nr:hypothetical protein [Colwellia sp.]